MDDREKREWEIPYDVDEVIDLDIPAWYLRLTAPIAGRWRRELSLVVAVLSTGLVVGLIIGFGLARRIA
jgi:hypothetical protein